MEDVEMKKYVALTCAFVALVTCLTANADTSQSPVNLVWLIHQSSIDGSQPVDHLYLGLRGCRTAVAVYNYAQPKPSVEVDQNLWSFKGIGEGGVTAWNHDNGKWDLGFIQSYSGKVLGGKLNVCTYFTRDYRGDWYWQVSSSTRLLWQVNQKWSAGIGLGACDGESRRQELIMGPVAEVRTNIFGCPTTLRVRMGQWLSGPSKNDHQLRLDWVTSL